MLKDRGNIDIVLHDHMDGSATLVPILRKLYRLSGIPCPFEAYNLDELALEVKESFNDPHNDIVEEFKKITKVLQTRECLRLFGRMYAMMRATQQYRYVEGRFAPQYHTFGGLSIKEIIQSVIGGIQEAEQCYPDLEANLILCVGRELEPHQAVELVTQFHEADPHHEYVVGIDLACNEAAFSPQRHYSMYVRAHSLGFKTTCHAGEWVKHRSHKEKDTPKKILANFGQDWGRLTSNIDFAINVLRANRVGHAITLGEEIDYFDDLIQPILRDNIGIEGCPGSNLKTKLIPNTHILQIRNLLNQGIPYSLNPDDDLFLPTMEETWQICDSEYNFTSAEAARLRENAWRTRFGRRKYQSMPELPVETIAAP